MSERGLSAAVWKVVNLNLLPTFSHLVALCRVPHVYLEECTWSDKKTNRGVCVLTETVFGGLDRSPRVFLLKFVFSHGLTGPESPVVWGKVL